MLHLVILYYVLPVWACNLNLIFLICYIYLSSQGKSTESNATSEKLHFFCHNYQLLMNTEIPQIYSEIFLRFFFFQFCQKADNCSKNEKNVLTFKHFVMHSQRCLFLLAGIYHWKWLVKHTAYYWDNLGFLSYICICMHSWFRRFILYVPDTKRCWTCVVTAEFKKSA